MSRTTRHQQDASLTIEHDDPQSVLIDGLPEQIKVVPDPSGDLGGAVGLHQVRAHDFENRAVALGEVVVCLGWEAEADTTPSSSRPPFAGLGCSSPYRSARNRSAAAQ